MYAVLQVCSIFYRSTVIKQKKPCYTVVDGYLYNHYSTRKNPYCINNFKIIAFSVGFALWIPLHLTIDELIYTSTLCYQDI